MCGTPAPTIEPLQALSAIPDEFSGTDQEACASSSDSQQKPPKPWLRRLIPIITVSIATIFFAWSAHEVRKSKLSKAPSAVCEECTSLASQGGKSLQLARAAEWIRKMRKIPPSSIDNPPNASTA
jgi:hypothetical protein